jgi:hypothetical protein
MFLFVRALLGWDVPLYRRPEPNPKNVEKINQNPIKLESSSTRSIF